MEGLLFLNISWKSVVLPVPFEPTRATLSVDLISKLTSSKSTSSKARL